MTVATLEVTETYGLLTHADRCDRCSARAYVIVILKRSRRLRRGGELKACAHHWHAWETAIKPHVAHLFDERAELTRHITDDGHIN